VTTQRPQPSDRRPPNPVARALLWLLAGLVAFVALLLLIAPELVAVVGG
jgi:hypothetical protein